jgi:phosphatidylglycerol---prolipoprotein diacylglyceryl transferase
VIVAAIVGARAVHVLANLSSYRHDPVGIFEVWNGGLSSFGGLALALPVGLISARRRCPSLRLGPAADLVTPVLVAAWAVGRLLGPQFEYAGGGKATHAWYGMYYAGEIGRRIPVPIFQALECFAVYLIALRVERLVMTRGGPTGLVTTTGVALWSLTRFFDEYFWLTYDHGTDAIEIGSIALFVLGVALAIWLVARYRRHPPEPIPADADEIAGGVSPIDQETEPDGVGSAEGSPEQATSR